MRDLKNLLQDLGRLAPLRDPVAAVSHELTPPQLHSVLWLGADGPLSSNVLATRVGCGQPTITGVIDRLEKLGYAERERDESDRRVVRVKLTTKGRAVYDDLDQRITGKLGLWFAAMSREDGDHFNRIIARVVDKFRARVAENT